MATKLGNFVVRQVDHLKFFQPFDFGQREFTHVVIRQIKLRQLGERQQWLIQVPNEIVTEFQYLDHRRFLKLVRC